MFSVTHACDCFSKFVKSKQEPKTCRNSHLPVSFWPAAS